MHFLRRYHHRREGKSYRLATVNIKWLKIFESQEDTEEKRKKKLVLGKPV